MARVVLIVIGLLILMGIAGFFYLLNVADGMAPPAGEETVEVDVVLPR